MRRTAHVVALTLSPSTPDPAVSPRPVAAVPLAPEPDDPAFSRLAFRALAFLAAIVHWIPPFPPQIDLPQHAGQIRLLHDWASAGFAHRDILTLNFFTPYLPAYLAGAGLTAVIPAVVAVKLLWTLGTLGTIWASIRLRRVLGGCGKWDWLLLPGLFGVTFQWGFLTFLIALPLGLLIVEFWVRNLESPSRRGSAAIAIALSLLFFAHALVTGWVLAVCGVMLLAGRPSTSRAWLTFAQRTIPLLAPLPVMMLWYAATRNAEQTQVANQWDWTIRYLEFFPQWLGIRDRVLTPLAGAMMIALPFMTGARGARRLLSYAPLLVTLGILLFGPNMLYGNALTYNRFFILLGPAMICALVQGDQSPRPSWRLSAALPTLAAAWILFFTVRMVRFAAEQQDFVRILRVMEPRQRTLSVVQDRHSGALDNSRGYLHFPVWYQAQGGGIVEPSFAAYLPMIVRFRTQAEESVSIGFEFRPDLAAVRRLDRFRYVLVRSATTDRPQLGPYPLTLLAHEGRWWLYTPESTPR
jgi:hypothetical protein